MKKCIGVLVIMLTLIVGCDAELPRPGHGAGHDTKIAVGTAPTSVEIADVNRDGNLDLIVANGGSHNVTILLGDGSACSRKRRGRPCAGHTKRRLYRYPNKDGKLVTFKNHK